MTLDAPLMPANPSFLAFTAEELEVQSAAASFLKKIVPIEHLHESNSADLNDRARRDIGDTGWFSLSLSEAFGGSGLSPVEHALFFRECGRECAPLAILAQSLSVLASSDSGDFQSSLMSGEQGVMLAARDGEGYRLLGARNARYAVLAERDAAMLFDVSDVQIGWRACLDPATSMGFAASLPRKALISRSDASLFAMAQLGAAAMLVGVAERAVMEIVEYAKIRETFGRKIGAYQAVRHPCADMELRAEAARSQLWYAAASLKEGRPDTGAHLDAAKHIANEAAVANADVNIQLHGGIGVTDEHNAHLLLKRALLLGRLFGCKRTLLPRLLHAKLHD